MMETYFDSPERESPDKIVNDYLLFKVNPLISEILEGFPEFVVILNKQRQIVAFNGKAYVAFNVEKAEELLGKRVGEAINCVHSRLMDGGCGTSMFCKECGAAKAVKKTNDTRQNSQEECKITAIQNNKEISFEYLVNTQPIVFKNSEFTLFSVKDISSIKRKEALERIFFHDILNTGGAIHGIAQLLSTANNEAERKEYIASLISSSAQLLDEIQNQRELQNAEEGNLITSIQTVSANQILETAFKLYNKNELNAGRILTVTYLDEDVYFKTDRTLLVRSIGNLIKNALEASSDGEMVKIYSFVTDENVFFNVYNQQLIPENVQLQLFKRSFSTKPNKGRGIGLYSVKLIIEQYLKGKVSFVSSPEIGTVFTLDMPKN